MPTKIFPLIVLNGRPAAGKSELIRAVSELPLETRIARFHIGPLHVIDDFPMLWAWFEEDQILEEAFRLPRLHTTPDEYFLHDDLWHLLVRRLSLTYEKWTRDASEPHTVIMEFSRGGEHGGYEAAYQHLSQQVLEHAVSLYVKVSYEESVRKNQTRFNPDRPDSILEHGLSSEKLDRLYRVDDWESFTEDDPNYIHVRDNRIPYTIFENEDDVTTAGNQRLFDRLQEYTDRLWDLKYHQRAV
jgi:hypothetical protein